MRKKVLALAGCIATTAPTLSYANVLLENIAGLSLGEVSSNSSLNQPFKGVIPFLSSSEESVSKLSVNLAPESVFKEVGVERDSILSHLNFQITQQNQKPVILISSDIPIPLPFLNFVLEIKGPVGSLYQDYTVLLDPSSKEVIPSIQGADSIAFNNAEIESSNDFERNAEIFLNNSGDLLQTTSLLSSKKKLKYRVKTGDSLSKIAQEHKVENLSVKKLSRMIFQKNPTAFIRGDVDRIKKGALLNLPTWSEVQDSELAQKDQMMIAKKTNKKLKTDLNTHSASKSDTHKYTVVKGDNLSKITKKFSNKDISFTKMMSAIYNENQKAFVNKSKNKLIAGVELNIPTFETKAPLIESENIDQQLNVEQELLAESNTEELRVDQYRIKRGDTLSYIAKTFGHKEVPFAKVLKSIYKNNPEAFVDGNMAKLLVGSLITLPPLKEPNFNITEVTKVAYVSDLNRISALKLSSPTKKADAKMFAIANNKNVSSDDLVKRIRELRKELNQTKGKLSEFKRSLGQKELLLQQKNIQLDTLKSTLTKYTNKENFKLVPASTVPVTPKAVENSEENKSKQELARYENHFFNKQEKAQEQIKKIKEIQSKILSPNDISENIKAEGWFKKYAESDVISFTKTNYAYLTMALILSLLLIRYRRELYSYTYTSISSEEPSYYPIPDADKLVLREKNITYHSFKDEDGDDYDDLTEESAEPKIVINKVLVETENDIFANSEELKEIEHCEDLVTELFDDLSTDKDASDNVEWDDIEQVCDTYIEKIKKTDGVTNASKNDSIDNDDVDFNHMMSDLLSSLDKVDKSVKRNKFSDDTVPDIVASSQAALAKAKKSNLSFPPPKS